MAVIFSDNKNPYFNLALEEYLLKNSSLDEDILLFWQSDKAFVFGRNQNPFVEINPKYFDLDIPIIRRVSGGGTIFHSSNDLVFCFITKNYEKKINDYEYFLNPVIKALKRYNLNVSFKPKSHLYIGEHKISGNAQAFINNKLLHHGTLLIDSDLKIINEALVNYTFNTKGNHILSNKQIVANIDQFLEEPCRVNELMGYIIDEAVKLMNLNNHLFSLKEEELSLINDLVKSKYTTWEWNFGKTKPFEVEMEFGSSKAKLFIENGIIKNVTSKKFDHLIGLQYYSKDYFEKIKQI
ncbi:MAG: biotin/lipoate A/B protein ligase family protein [Candidatus Izemoplasmatales bacterium]|jgi:lipoate-protein ligase A|nr:biotin/lipoate A/B protein ligase family protein [Candidatus Izemoplasmatales bacterium]